jgi:hypothetical protein
MDDATRQRLWPNLKPIPKGEHRGRKPGVPNKIPPQLKKAVVEVATKVGEDGHGKNGLVGFLTNVAREEPKIMVRLLGRILQLELRELRRRQRNGGGSAM